MGVKSERFVAGRGSRTCRVRLNSQARTKVGSPDHKKDWKLYLLWLVHKQLKVLIAYSLRKKQKSKSKLLRRDVHTPSKLLMMFSTLASSVNSALARVYLLQQCTMSHVPPVG